MTCENVTISGDNGTPITAYVVKRERACRQPSSRENLE